MKTMMFNIFHGGASHTTVFDTLHIKRHSFILLLRKPGWKSLIEKNQNHVSIDMHHVPGTPGKNSYLETAMLVQTDGTMKTVV